jgi:HEPN domain-containing protein
VIDVSATRGAARSAWAMVYKTAVGYVEFSRWLVLARRMLESTGRNAESGDFNWACFKARQAAEFAAKGLLYGAERPARGHSVYMLLETANELLPVPKEFLELGKLLDRFYIPTRYVDAWSEGVSFEYFTRGDAKAALIASEKILAFVEELWRACLDSGRR